MDNSTELLVMFQQLGNYVFIPLLLSSIRPFALTRVSEMTRKMFFYRYLNKSGTGDDEIRVGCLVAV